MTIEDYDPKDVVISINGRVVEGSVDGKLVYQDTQERVFPEIYEEFGLARLYGISGSPKSEAKFLDAVQKVKDDLK